LGGREVGKKRVPKVVGGQLSAGGKGLLWNHPKKKVFGHNSEEQDVQTRGGKMAEK